MKNILILAFALGIPGLALANEGSTATATKTTVSSQVKGKSSPKQAKPGKKKFKNAKEEQEWQEEVWDAND